MSAGRNGSGRNPSGPASDRVALGWWPDPEQLPLRSVMQGDHQLIFNELAPGRDELYDVVADPMTQHDLALEKPDLVTRLRALGIHGMRENRPIEAAQGNSELILTPQIHDQLRALGYER